MKSSFEWEEEKNQANIKKHGVSFYEAQKAFLDSKRVILKDIEHSQEEAWFYCLGKVDGMVMMLRFTYREYKIRLFGAGYWRKGKKVDEKASIH